ncbi:hypothetical protein [Mycolicibacterium goodii]|uniref:hypothetical protein n=1 Tax=Mycolicibacterium goodii TaxID=134601 RepID=UPI000C25AD19|nr:hypothetical protein [Mycolicibacterium goodii]PJK21012.1 hypothetical protein CSX11_17980 [Mycolicibacterium goodii]
MMPIAAFEAITTDTTLNALGITADTVLERQSINGDERPAVESYFVVVDFQEQSIIGAINRGPRVLDIAVHIDATLTRDYGITRILNAIDSMLLPIEQITGSDGIRVTGIRPMGRARNLIDTGWNTTTRAAQYSMLYDEYAA